MAVCVLEEGLPAVRPTAGRAVSLTDKGRATREPLRAMWSTLEQVTVGGLDAEAAVTFVETAERIRRAVEARGTRARAASTVEIADQGP